MTFFQMRLRNLFGLATLELLIQGWPTQANWEKITKSINFLGRILAKAVGNHPKYRKITEFQSADWAAG
jgi:hypothetical protein